MQLHSTRVMVIGLGVSGRAAASFLARRGAHLTMVDARPDIAVMGLPEGELHLGPDNPLWLRGIELVVISPGVPTSSALVRTARSASIPVIGELELASRFIEAPIVAVTGTNGKSTVTELVGRIFATAGLKTFIGGNLGTPLLEAVGGSYDVLVVEVSSYQLETIQRFKPRVAIYLNLSADHLDRYRDLAEYGRAKERIFENQDGGDFAILNRDDAMVWRVAPLLSARTIAFGLSAPSSRPAIWPEAGNLIFDDESGRATISLQAFLLSGRHNLLNAMAAAAAALVFRIEPAAITRTLAEFRALPHRIELVRIKGGVRFIDDSKGTNVGAVLEALASSAAPVILIAGGVDKGGSYEPLREAMREKVKLTILIGAAREKMRQALAGVSTIECVPGLSDAVALAVRTAAVGDTVLLSPACSSFDQFKDYAERGSVFQKLVRAL